MNCGYQLGQYATMLCSKCQRASGYVLLIRRLMSAQEAAVALRPFYFAVHPDRFANNPVAREQNEKSLQTFNGYLNDLFPARVAPQPVQLLFYLYDEQKHGLRKINISLAGSDVPSLIRSALEECGLPTSGLPPPSAAQVSFPDLDSYRMELLKKYRRNGTKGHKVDNLKAALKKHKKIASEIIGRNREMLKHVRTETDEFKRRTGVTEVIWTMHWSITHIRRCLIALHRIMDDLEESAANDSNHVIEALRGYSLRFGVGSFVCCDGGMQFAVDSVPEEWEGVCSEATVRRAQLPLLALARKQLSDLLGRAEIVTPKHHSLANTLNQIQVLISSIVSRDRSSRMRLKCLGLETVIEVVNVYGELACAQDGRLLIPCNVDIVLLLHFLTKYAHMSRSISCSNHRLQAELEMLKCQCITELKLSDITWQDGINKEDLKSSFLRLKQSDQATRELLEGMALHFSTNPTIYVMTDGKISLPVSWK